MDWLEVKLRAAFAWGRKRWDRLPKRARITLKILAPCLSLTFAYLSGSSGTIERRAAPAWICFPRVRLAIRDGPRRRFPP